MVELLSELRDEGHAIVTITHDEALVSALADRVVRVGGEHVLD
jgi:energy-coupling factor transport system ATP-binding protein